MRLGRTPSGVALEIEDEGVGFDPAAVQRLMETAKPLILDVREMAEWQAERGAPIVTVCKIGYRGGLDAWKAAHKSSP